MQRFPLNEHPSQWRTYSGSSHRSSSAACILSSVTSFSNASWCSMKPWHGQNFSFSLLKWSSFIWNDDGCSICLSDSVPVVNLQQVLNRIDISNWGPILFLSLKHGFQENISLTPRMVWWLPLSSNIWCCFLNNSAKKWYLPLDRQYLQSLYLKFGTITYCENVHPKVWFLMSLSVCYSLWFNKN